MGIVFAFESFCSIEEYNEMYCFQHVANNLNLLRDLKLFLVDYLM